MTHLKALTKFLEAAPSSYLAADYVVKELQEKGFEKLAQNEKWTLKAGGRYVVPVHDSAVMAFVLPKSLKKLQAPVYRMIGAHLDHPCFKLKPSKELENHGYVRLNTEIYGGPIYSTWLDRPLSLSGRVTLKGKDALHPLSRLVDLKEPVLVIPNMAIHMNRELNDGFKYNPQSDLLPVAALSACMQDQEELVREALSKKLKVGKDEILDYDLFTYPVEPPMEVGFHKEFFSSKALDDLVMVYPAYQAIAEAEPKSGINIFLGFDHEEVGSETPQGANSATMSFLLEKLSLAIGRERSVFLDDLMESFIISADVAHAIHPAHPEKHEIQLQTQLGAGPVMKLNARQSYVTQSRDIAVFESICREAGVPCQKFVNRSDTRGGSTIGPDISSYMPCHVMDMGIALLSMHSSRELMAVADLEYTLKAFSTYYAQ